MVAKELVRVAELLIKRGVKVSVGSVQIYNRLDDDAHIVEMSLELEQIYLEYLFHGMPPGWELQDFYRQDISRVVSRLHCSDILPECESDDESIEFSKQIMITNLESWLEDRDPKAFKAILLLAGEEVVL
jgi:hypothetical protein